MNLQKTTFESNFPTRLPYVAPAITDYGDAQAITKNASKSIVAHVTADAVGANPPTFYQS